jgi:hypothetical protein
VIGEDKTTLGPTREFVSSGQRALPDRKIFLPEGKRLHDNPFKKNLKNP